MSEMTSLGRHRNGRPWGALVVALLLLGGCATAHPNAFCFNDNGYPASGPPVIDGNPAELNWTESFRYVAENGGSTPHVIVQGLKEFGYLYLSFEVNNDPFFNDKDAILLGFSPGGGAANDRRIFIFPLCDGVGLCNNAPGVPRSVIYWNNSANWSNNSGVTDPGWLTNTGNVNASNIRVMTPGPNSWQVEMRIPINNVAANADPALDAGINVPASGTFGFWFDVIRVSSAPGTPPNMQTANELAWPPGAAYVNNLTNIINLTSNMPAPNTWGTGRRDGVTSACNGVSVEWSGIQIEHPASVNPIDSWILSLNQANVFTVTPYNDSTDTNGNFIDATGVQATFRIKNAGLPGPNWQMPGVLRGNPVANNPTAPGTIPAAAGGIVGFAKLSTGAWNLNTQEQTDFGANPGQCVLVDLDAPGTNTVIKTKSTHSNMTFMSTASPFKVRPTIDMSGYRLAEKQDQLEFQLSTFTYHTDPEQRWSTAIDGLPGTPKGQYLLKGKLGDQVVLSTTITPPSITIPSVDMRLAPGTGGRQRKPEVVKVEPGHVLTLLTHGSIRVRAEAPGQPSVSSGPNGVRLAKTDRSTASAFILRRQQDPTGRVGALIGSWDNFAESRFVIGSAMTLKVPERAQALYLAINDTPEGFAQHSGEGFHIQLISTPLEKKYIVTDSRLARDPSREAILMPLAANLPVWMMCGELKTGKTLVIGQDSFALTDNVGCFGYALRKIGR
jgi:hypothetical protein